MNAKPWIIVLFLAISFNASAFTLGPLEITLTSGPNVNISFTNQFRGLLNSISGVIQNNTVVKFIKYALNYGSTSENIQIVPGKNNAIIPPAGWTDANTPPSTTNQVTKYKSNYSATTYNTREEACQAIITNNSSFPGYTFAGLQYGTVCILKDSTGYPNTNFYTSVVIACPDGYTVSGSSCSLTNAAIVKWPSDGKPTFYQGTDGQIKLHPRDPDLPSATGAGGSFAGGGASGSWRVPATDAYSNPVQVDHTVTPDGGMDISRKLETVKPETGKPTVYEEIDHFNDQGAITNHYNNEYPNTTITTINNSGGTPSTTQTIQFPTITVSGNGGNVSSFNRGNTPTASQSLTDFKNYLRNHPIIKPLREATWSPSGQSCPMTLAVSMSPFGYPMNLSTDIMCQITEIMRPVISTVTTFAWSWLALTVILGA